MVHFLGNLFGFLGKKSLLDGHDDSVLVLNNSGSFVIVVQFAVASFFGLSFFSWEKNEFANVLLESENVLLERLVGLIGSSGVDGDSD